MAFNWTCPYCNHVQTVVPSQQSHKIVDIRIADQAEGPLACEILAIGCANAECRKTTVKAGIGVCTSNLPAIAANIRNDDYIYMGVLIPDGGNKILPEYIPKPIREDYREACKIIDLSPKASATLIRRCLQGMIRDFAGIQRGTLNSEITALKQAVESGTADRSITCESVDAIDHIRTIGNIGAHMEKDINTIIDVDPNEAETLIEVAEMLFEEWYGDRHRRAERLARVKGIAESKKEQKSLPSPAKE